MQVDSTETGLRRIFEKSAKTIHPSLGAMEDLYTIPPRNRDKDTVRIEIHTGTHAGEVQIDSYTLSIGDGRKVPDFGYFENFITVLKPFEAFLAEDKNEYRLNAYDRQQAEPGFTRPAIIRGFHYLDEGMADSIGGIKYCLKAPAWRVRKFCEGVLIELVPGLFDPTNPEHLRIQEEVMTYFSLW